MEKKTQDNKAAFVKIGKLDSTHKQKYIAHILDADGEELRYVKFGTQGGDNFLNHRDEGKKRRYIARHKGREDWSRNGIFSRGFWSRWLLWSEPTMEEARANIEELFNVKFV